MEAYAVGVVGIRLDDLEFMPPSVFIRAINEFNNFNKEKSEESIELTKLIGFWQFRSMGSDIQSPDDLINKKDGTGEIKSIKVERK